MKNLMEYKGYYAKIEYDSEDNLFFGVINDIDDSVSFEGSNADKLKSAFHESVDDYIDMCHRLNKEPQKHYKGNFNVHISPEIHKRAAINAISNGMSLNQFVEKAIEQRLGTN